MEIVELGDTRATSGERIAVDLRESTNRLARGTVLTKAALDLLKTTVAGGGRAVVSVNRRGYSSSLKCYECGHIPRCPRCSVGLSFHRESTELRCHYCNVRIVPPESCPGCGGLTFERRGTGVERLAKTLRTEMPGATVYRVDLDAVKQGTNAWETMHEFSSTPASLLVGTYMVAKPLYQLSADAVVVLDADALLDLPDFRASEKTFQTLMRFSQLLPHDRDAAFVVQSYRPEHFAVQAGCAGDYELFFSHELREREAAGFPPFSSLVEIVFRGRDRPHVIASAEAAAKRLETSGFAGRYLGPGPRPVERVRGSYRWHLLLRGESVSSLAGAVAALSTARVTKGSVKMSIDVDPVHLV
jgi:primosomal protein N' (replication factor Y)